MLKEAQEAQSKLFEPLGGSNNIDSKIAGAGRAFTPEGKTLNDLAENGPEKFAEILGEFAPKVLLVTNPNNPKTLVPEQIAAAGGWCAIRTKDLTYLNNQGVMMNPETGRLDKVQSVDQVADWVMQAVAFDQVAEAIGPVRAGEYVAISERRLWAGRLVDKTRHILRRSLSTSEQDTLERAVEAAEQVRAQMTQRYIEFVTQKPGVIFQRVVDDDIWDGLRSARTEMLLKGDLSLSQLRKWYPDEAPFMDSSSLVWAMYAEPYFDLLRSEGYISAKQVFIVEPIMHATAETRPEIDLTQKIFQRAGIYGDPKGFNANTGFIAFVECLNKNGRNVRKEMGIGEVPNIVNWQKFLAQGGTLDPEKNATIIPKDNQLYIWGVNFMPFGQTREALLSLVQLQRRFLEEKAQLQRLYGEVRDDNTVYVSPEVGKIIGQKTNEMKQEYAKIAAQQNEIIAKNLRKLFSHLTEGIRI